MLGQIVGAYQIIDHIGEGGFGHVFRAEQLHPIRREVAVKILKPGMDSKAVLTRFEQERHALALLDHPAIARILDAGATPDGRPFVALELVKGEPIDTYCDRHRLDLRQRIALLKTVCEAVQHAHQRGIIHRDLKPSNILISSPVSPDGPPVAKIIDFGIAKATSDALSPTSTITGAGQLVGTPLYMSPEQADSPATDIDTRTDIYSLGVLLYQLLTGTTPLDPRSLGKVPIATVQQMIRQLDPPRPSTRIRTISRAHKTSATPDDNPAPTAAQIAEARSTDAPRLTRTLFGELDWIVMKAIDKDRSRRYEAASALAADLGRYLRGDAVEAGPPSRLYLLRVLVRRNRLAFLTAAAIILALLTGLTLAAVGLVQASHERDRALQASLREATARTEAERLLTSAAMAAAFAGIQGRSGAVALTNLSAVPADQRSWEWQVLHRLADPAGIHIRLDPNDRIKAVWPMSNPHRAMAVSVNPADGLLTINLLTGEIVRRFPGGHGAISPNDRLIAQAINRSPTEGSPTEPAIIVRDANTGSELWRTPPASTQWDLGIASFSLDSSELVATDSKGTLFFFESTTGRQLRSVLPSPPCAWLLGFVRQSPANGPAVLYHDTTGRWSMHTDATTASLPTLMGFRLSASRSTSSTGAKFLPLGTGVTTELTGHTFAGQLTTADLSSSGALAIFGDTFGGITLARPTAGQPDALSAVAQFQAADSGIAFATLSSDDQRIILGTISGRWSVVPVNRSAADFSPKSPRSNAAAFSADRRFIVRAGWGEASLIDTNLALPLWSQNLSSLIFRLAAFSPDQTRIALATAPRTPGTPSELYILDAATGHPLLSLGKSAATADSRWGRSPPPTLGEIKALTFSPDGDHVLLTLADGSIQAVNATTGDTALMQPPPGDPPQSGPMFMVPNLIGGCIAQIIPEPAASSANPTAPATASSRIVLRSAQSLVLQRTINLQSQQVTAVAPSTDGASLYLGTTNGAVLCLDLTTATPRWRTEPSGASCLSLTVSPDGVRLIAAFDAPQLTSINTATGQTIATLPGSASAVLAMAFTTSTDALLIASGDRALGRLDSIPLPTSPSAAPFNPDHWPTSLPRPASLLQARAWMLDAHQLTTEAITASWSVAAAKQASLARTEFPKEVRALAAELIDRQGFPLRDANNRALLVLIDPAVTTTQLAQAAELLADLTVRNQSDPAIHLNLGEALFRLERFAQCISVLERGEALQTDRGLPASARTRYTLAIAHIRAGNTAEAAACLRAADQLAQTDRMDDDPVATDRQNLARQLISPSQK